MELIKQLESLLFSSGKAMPTEELARLCKSREEDVKNALAELKKLYDEKQGSLMVMDEGDFWKITVREGYLPLVSKIVTETELSKTLIETLAVIAWKAPVLQSTVIGTRTNKAYEHLAYLEEAGYIAREKHGRTKLIKLGQKFFDYFELPKEAFREKFSKFEDMEGAIAAREQEARKIKQEIEARKEEVKKSEERKSGLAEEEHKKIDSSIEQLEKEAFGVAEEHEAELSRRTVEEEKRQEWKAIASRKKESKKKEQAEQKAEGQDIGAIETHQKAIKKVRETKEKKAREKKESEEKEEPQEPTGELSGENEDSENTSS